MLLNIKRLREGSEISDREWRQRKPHNYQHDSAPFHKGKTTPKWMSYNLDNYITTSIWRPNTPNMNPFDYYIWDVIKREVN